MQFYHSVHAKTLFVPVQVIQEYSSLQNFWKRYNKVLLDKLALDREHQVLENENSKLKMLLKQYLDGEFLLKLV